MRRSDGVPSPSSEGGCDGELVKMLHRCSRSNDLREWKAWRDENAEQEVWLW